VVIVEGIAESHQASSSSVISSRPSQVHSIDTCLHNLLDALGPRSRPGLSSAKPGVEPF
jgi:hypothetical protein